MANEPSLTVVGNLTADPELRFTPSGSAVANFTLACTPRTFNRTTNAFEDGETLFQRCNFWREPAENFVESVKKGDAVIATGLLKSRSYETKEGEKRTVMELEVQDAGPSVRYATAKPVRTQRSGGQNGQQGGGQQGQQQYGGQQPVQQGGYVQPQGQPQGGYQQQGVPNTAYTNAQQPQGQPQGGYQQPMQGAPQGGYAQPVQGQQNDPWVTPPQSEI